MPNKILENGYFGAILFIGGICSLTISIIVLIFAIRKRVTRIANSAVIYNFCIVMICNTIPYLILGISFFYWLNKEIPLISDSEHSEFFFWTFSFADFFLTESGCFSILLIFDSYLSFKEPLRVYKGNCWKIFFTYLIGIILHVICAVLKLNYSLEPDLGQRIYEALLSAIFFFTILILFIKMRLLIHYYKKEDSVFVWQIISVQKVYCVIYFLLLIWDIIYANCLAHNICIIMNFSITSFYTLVSMSPFMFNIYKVLHEYPKQIQQSSLTDLSLLSMREELLLLVMKGIQKMYEKKSKKHRKRTSQLNHLASPRHNQASITHLDSYGATLLDFDYGYREETIEMYDTSTESKEEVQEEIIKIHIDSNFSSEFNQISQKKELKKGPFSLVDFYILGADFFESVREKYKVSLKNVAETFSAKKYNEGKITINVGISNPGKFWISSENSDYCIKSTSKEEYLQIKRILPNLYTYIINQDYTSLYPVFGAFSIGFPNACQSQKIYFILCHHYASKLKALESTGSSLRFQLDPTIKEKKMDTFLDWKSMKSDQLRKILMENKNLRMTPVKNFTIEGRNAANILRLLTTDIEFLRQNRLASYNLSFFVSLKDCSVVVGDAIKDYIIQRDDFLNYELNNKLFFYYFHGVLYCKEVHATHSIEYHIANPNDLDLIKRSNIIPILESMGTNEKLSSRNFDRIFNRRLRASTKKSYNMENIIINFSEVINVVREKENVIDDDDDDDDENASPFPYLCPNDKKPCAYCDQKINHFYFIKYTSDKKICFMKNGSQPICQLLFLWEKNLPVVWKAMFKFSINHYLQQMNDEVCPNKYCNEFLAFLLRYVFKHELPIQIQ